MLHICTAATSIGTTQLRSKATRPPKTGGALVMQFRCAIPDDVFSKSTSSCRISVQVALKRAGYRHCGVLDLLFGKRKDERVDQWHERVNLFVLM